jgi:hypothetical protein
VAPSLVQVSNGSGVFPSAVTVGNTVLLTVGEFSAPTVTVTAVKLGTTTVTGTTQLEFPQTAGGGSGNPQGVCVVMLPNVQVSGQTTVNYTCSGSVIGTYAEEWAGLGTSPTLDTAGSISASGASASIASGTTGATTQAAELIFGVSATYAGTTSSPTGSTWSSTTGLGGGHMTAGHIIQSASGATYTWNQTVTGGGSSGWAVAIVAVYSASTSHTATAALTVTPTFAAAAAQHAAAALTVTPVLSATASGGAPSHTAAASLTVTPTFGAAPRHGHNPTAALTVAPVLSAATAHGHAPSAALTVTPSFSAVPSGGASAVTVAASWSVVGVTASGFFFPVPAARPLQVAVTNTPGDWLIMVATWRQAQAGEGVSVSVADDAHNWWEPWPSGDSAAAGVTRCAIWAAPAARVANTATGVTNIQVAVSGTALALAVRILDVSGMQPWMTMTPVVTNYALAATSLSLSAAAPSAQALMIACAGSDNNSDTLGGPGAGWTSLAPVAGSNGVDRTADITLSSAWQVTSASAAAAWTSSGALDFSGVIAGVLVSAAAPLQPNPAWPVVITEIAPGAGAQTLPALLSWVPLSARALSLTVQQGRQYTLAQLQAGQGTLVADNPDGALIPPGTGALAGIDSGTPVRQRVIVPAAPSPYYTAFSGYMQRWPWAAPGDMLRGETQATLTDAWGYAAGLLNSMAREEMLLDDPYALWPLDDPAGSLQGSNLAPGNSRPLTLTLSKYGASGAAVAFGANSGALIGDSSARIAVSGVEQGAEGMYSQTVSGASLASNSYGYALVCADPGYPPIANGVTIETFLEAVLDTQDAWPFTATTSGSVFNSANSSFAAGQPITLEVASGFTLPGGFAVLTVYYVIAGTGGSFQLSATPGGSAITVTSSGAGFLSLTTPYNPVVLSARSVKGVVAEIHIRNTDGALVLLYQTAAGASSTVVADSGHDYRFFGGLAHVSLALNQTAWRVLVNGGSIATASGSFSASLPAAFTELDLGGIVDRGVQGYALPGYLALAAVYPLFLAQIRVINHFAAATGLANEAACDRVERVLEYAGLTGRRWLGQQVITGEGDLTVSGQDVGGQGAATSAGNIAASTVPAMLYVAPTGDITYLSKFYTWNQPVRWTLGDNVAGGEIPFRIGQFSTDYDNSRVVNDIQITQLDTQTVTVPSGVMASTTLAAVEAASEAQYGDQPYQVTGYLTYDATSPYSAGSSEVDLANWIADVYARPKTRVQSVTVNAAANAANASSSRAWQFWAGASVGDMVAVNVRMPTAATSPLISLVARITQTQRAGQFSQDGTSATIACVLDFAPEYNALICDDAVRGLLNGVNVLAY